MAKKTHTQEVLKIISYLLLISSIVLMPAALKAALITTTEFQLEDLHAILSIAVDGDRYTYSFDQTQSASGWKISHMSIGFGYDVGGSMGDPTAWGFPGGANYPDVAGNQESVGSNGITIYDYEDSMSTQVAFTSSVDPFYIEYANPLDYQYIWVKAVGPQSEIFPGAGIFFNPTVIDEANDDGKVVFPKTSINTIPEPVTLVLLSLSLGAVLVYFRKTVRRKK